MAINIVDSHFFIQVIYTWKYLQYWVFLVEIREQIIWFCPLHSCIPWRYIALQFFQIERCLNSLYRNISCKLWDTFRYFEYKCVYSETFLVWRYQGFFHVIWILLICLLGNSMNRNWLPSYHDNFESSLNLIENLGITLKPSKVHQLFFYLLWVYSNYCPFR